MNSFSDVPTIFENGRARPCLLPKKRVVLGGCTRRPLLEETFSRSRSWTLTGSWIPDSSISTSELNI